MIRTKRKNKILGTKEKPRLVVTKTNSNIYAQLIDDINRNTLVFCSSVSKTNFKSANIDTAEKIGNKIAKMAASLGIEKVVFDRNRFPYHGLIKALAESARQSGLIF